MTKVKSAFPNCCVVAHAFSLVQNPQREGLTNPPAEELPLTNGARDVGLEKTWKRLASRESNRGVKGHKRGERTRGGLVEWQECMQTKVQSAQAKPRGAETETAVVVSHSKTPVMLKN